MDERNFRPLSLDDFVGQTKLKKTLGMMLESAQIRKVAMEHVCFFGGPGLGKTTLAAIIANELGGELRELAAPSIEKLGDLVSILAGLNPKDVLFLDEIHRMKPEVSETLYSAMEDFKVSVPIKNREDGETTAVTMMLNPFTLVGATTDFGKLLAPLQARFGHLFPLDLYTVDELEIVVARAADIGGMLIDTDSARIIAERGRGTPRLALRLFRRCLDRAITLDEDIILDITRQTMDILEVDQHGLDSADRRYLITLAETYGGGPVGPKSLAASSGLDQSTIEDAIEPWLLRSGLIARTRNGRRLLRKGWEHISKFITEDTDIPEIIEEPELEMEPDGVTQE
ncbi:MAG: Holliday junction branch migration DNA helicase RuvB [Anaerolineaceae bacterium]|nr:Holliday junction branch migration DNA helicase RuvB [Anaerolineaceae bacterium]